MRTARGLEFQPSKQPLMLPASLMTEQMRPPAGHLTKPLPRFRLLDQLHVDGYQRRSYR